MGGALLSGCECLLQAIVGIAGGATRAALVQHQARRENMADVAAKDSSQVRYLTLSPRYLGCLTANRRRQW